MDSQKIFNRGIASGEAFCNRSAEIDQIVKNIHNITHTLLIAPRRYGKTSLALRAIATMKLPYAYIDLFLKYDADSILEEFYQGIGGLMSKIIKPTARAIKQLGKVLKYLSVGLHYKEIGLEFKIEPKIKDKRKNIKELLLSIDELLAEQNKRAVIFIDEMQSIVETDFCDDVESALRFVAQKTHHITFIFSGSSRRLMSKIFEERSRPFYKLCQKMSLQRISKEQYGSFINVFAKKRWKQQLPEECYDCIFAVTKLHPYYLNILCSYLFESEQPPTPDEIAACWLRVCKEEQASVAKDIEFLTSKQKLLLSEIAKNPELKEPTSKQFVQQVNLSPRGVSLALKILLNHDLLERLESGVYRIIDPVLEYWLKSPKKLSYF